MHRKIYAIYDKIALDFLGGMNALFLARHDAVAIRTFGEVMTGNASMHGKAADYQLVYLGTVEDYTAPPIGHPDWKNAGKDQPTICDTGWHVVLDGATWAAAQQQEEQTTLPIGGR